MHLWMLTLLCATVYGISRISQSELKAVNFAKAVAGYKLNGSVFKEIEANSERSCQIACVGEEECLSYNFGPTNATNTTKKNAKRFMCQLSNSDRFVGFANFAEDKEFIYKGLQSACETDTSPCGHNEICIPNYQDDTVQCKCNDGFTGTLCKPISCAKRLQIGFTSSGVYTVNPDGGKSIQVLCDMTTDGGGWTVFQRRLDGSVDFYLDWQSYKNGFGDLKGEFWLGNDNLHRLTATDDVILRVDLEDFDGNKTYAEYTTFKVADEVDKYRLLIGGYSGTAGDSMAFHNGTQFSTKDNDNDRSPFSCSQRYKGAWWYSGCHRSNLNGLYLNGSHSSHADGVGWHSFRGHYYSLKRTEMKFKTKF